MLAQGVASGLNSREVKGPEEKPNLGEGFSDPGSTKILLLLSGKKAKAFLTLGTNPILRLGFPVVYLCRTSENNTVTVFYQAQEDLG
ncbi:hypothetical protein DSO57_1003538 [Entomophthora muscae]|uniref:Uncharacterized protein n=1 Tax=Entomophthora muscae TaxID=34485 RepID=A0ACC2SAN3_9FUNG|nr:hypothetical protein DSO57_1003538 [Entomophthora muscae]